ncbi:MAG: rhodanese-like domain-containing protein [Nitrospira sp.]|nr:rhodanese-like domain-containing protein [Nitrospira sp.]MCP9464927.1 rhodanese-like domain-containing protein [Nitrospira sp.]
MTRLSWNLMAGLLATVLMMGDVALGAPPSVLTVEQLHSALSKGRSREEKGFILVDVRTPQEHRAGMIPGTDFNIDFREIKSRHRELGAQPDDHIVVYCQSGRRSSIAAQALAELGYRHVYNVEGSMNAWMEAGFPVERPPQ